MSALKNKDKPSYTTSLYILPCILTTMDWSRFSALSISLTLTSLASPVRNLSASPLSVVVLKLAQSSSQPTNPMQISLVHALARWPTANLKPISAFCYPQIPLPRRLGVETNFLLLKFGRIRTRTCAQINKAVASA